MTNYPQALTSFFSQAPIGNTTANILKYKKYIKPLVCLKKC